MFGWNTEPMSDFILLAIGLLVGLLLGGLFAGLWVGGRLRVQSQRAEATTDELRKQLDLDRQDRMVLGRELAEAQQARAAAEARIESMTKQLADQERCSIKPARNSCIPSRACPARR